MADGAPAPGISRKEFVALAALLMAVDALAIDIMLPALPDMGRSLMVADANDRSLVLTAFLVGFGLPQLFFGPLTDRFGRRPPILLGLAVYVITALLATLAPTFAVLLALRFVQGVAAAAVRVALFSSVRDRYSGTAMADIMSFIFAVFLLVPIFMPGVGQLLLLVGPWQLTFVVMAAVAALSAVWAFFRLPESLAAENRRPLGFASVTESFRLVLSNRLAVGYGLSGLFLFGVILALVNTSQQVYVDIYGLGVFFPFAFAFMAGVSAIASLLAPRVINRLGLRRTAHAANLVFLVATTVWLILAVAGLMPVWLFLIMIAITMPTVVFGFSTTGALAMEPLGEVAGTASAVFGSMQTVGGAFLGYLVAQAFDGTVVPVISGLVVFGVCVLGCFLVAEKGRLFPAPPATVTPP